MQQADQECSQQNISELSATTPAESTVTPLSARASSRAKKRKQDDEMTALARQCLEEIKKVDEDKENQSPLDDEGKYGEYIACEMRKISNEMTKQILKAEIQSLFLKAHMGHLTHLGMTNAAYPPHMTNAAYTPQGMWSPHWGQQSSELSSDYTTQRL